jgi:putative membrane protein
MADIAGGLSSRVARAAIRAACRLAIRRVDLRVEGLRHLPATGPVIIAARHFHHFYDGCALLAVVPRRVHLVVTLDWLESRAGRRLMTWACDLAEWPVVPRPGLSPRLAAVSTTPLRAATRLSVALLRKGEALLVFPEGYPNIDPHGTPKTDDDAFLPFQSGFLRFAALAERDGHTSVAIVPTGLAYTRGRRWAITVRFGAPVTLAPGRPVAAQIPAIEMEVRRLSAPRDAKQAHRV